MVQMSLMPTILKLMGASVVRPPEVIAITELRSKYAYVINPAGAAPTDREYGRAGGFQNDEFTSAVIN